MKSIAVSLLFVLTGSYTVLVLFVVLFQDVFIDKNNLIFQPKTMSPTPSNSIQGKNIQTLEFITPDQFHLHGWLINNGTEEKTPLLIYFGGSSQEVSTMIPYFQKIDGWSIALVNYRGYGLSGGVPSEEHLFGDALLIYDALSKRADIDGTKIVAMGWSLGTGVAVYLSEQRPVSGTILVTPFDSWAHMFQSRDFPLIPLSLIHDKYFVFNSIQRAPSILNPLLCLVGSRDNIVLPALSQDLVDQWGGEATALFYEEADHGLLFQDNSSWEDISTFLKDME
ncbi:MAG: alpha/beta hydrolase [Anaerolineales bacterium]